MVAGPGTVADSGGTPCGSLNGGTGTCSPADPHIHRAEGIGVCTERARQCVNHEWVLHMQICRELHDCADAKTGSWWGNGSRAASGWLAPTAIYLLPAVVGCAPATSSTTAQRTASSTQSAAMPPAVECQLATNRDPAWCRIACCSRHLR
jgi:hypothetical protein